MKLREKYVEKYLANFHYELTRDQLEQEWLMDKKPYNKAKDCWNFHSENGCWLEVPDREIDKAFKDSDDLDVEHMVKLMHSDCDFKSAWPEKKKPKENCKGNSFYDGVEHEKKVAIDAFIEVFGAITTNDLDPEFDYLKMFKDKL